MRKSIVVAACLVAAAGCKKSDGGGSGSSAGPAAGASAGSAPGSASAGSAIAGVGATAGAADAFAKPAPPPKAGTIRPVATGKSIGLMVAKQPTWVEGDFACYLAGISMQPGTHAADVLNNVKPGIGDAFAGAGVDLDTEIQAVGGMSCAASMCIYAAMTLDDEAQGKRLLEALFPAGQLTTAKDGHQVATVQGPNGKREIHLRFIPLDWNGVVVPDDERPQRLRKATHLLFLSADDAGKPVVDPFTLVAAPDEARARLAALEGLATDPRGRCVEGVIAKSASFRPGFDLEGAQFLAATPPRAAGDAVAEMMSASRGLDLEIALDLSKAASKADVEGWVGEARSWFDNMAQAAASPEIAGMLRLFIESSFNYKIDGKRVTMSWKTERVPRAQLEKMDADLRAAGMTP
ncbi:MAG: hypothetical protein K8W52_41445 [Deltaproteobacteria bacterium]|nr:hypothetical protein [Deltaproteobacteria bacterium]